MDVVNPLSGNLAHSASIAQRQQSAGNAEQVRRAQALRKDIAARGGDHFDPTVESADAIAPLHDEHPDQRRRRRQRPPDPPNGPDAPHVDVTA
jgi:hypothetical protein